MKTKNYTVPEALIAKLSSEKTFPLKDFLKLWADIPYFVFDDDYGRMMIDTIQDLSVARYPALNRNPAFSDGYLPEKRLNLIIHKLSQKDDTAFRHFLADMEFMENCSFSDLFCHRLITLIFFLIQFQQSQLALELINIIPWIGRFEDTVDTSRCCIYTFAIETIFDDEPLFALLDTMENLFFGFSFMGRKAPALAAVEMGRYPVLKRLFEKGMCSEEMALADQTLLQYAASNGDLALAEFSLTQMAHDPDLMGLRKQTPLMIAVENDNLEFSSYLLTHNANVNATDSMGRSVLSYCKSPEMQTLLKQHHAAARDYAAEALSEAIHIGRNGAIPDSVIDKVIKYSPDTITYQGTNLALLAAHRGYVDNLKRLLAHYDLSDMADELACAAFHTAVALGKSVPLLIALADTLLAAGLTVKTPSVQLYTPYPTMAYCPEIFHQHSLCEAFELFDKVHALGYDPHATLFSGTNLLYSSIEGANLPLIQYCIEQGMSLLDLENSDGVASILLTRMPRSSQPELGQKNKEAEVWEYCRQMGCDINRRNSRGETALHALIRSAWVSEDMVLLALALGADPTIRNNNGETAAQLAANFGCKEEILLLLLS